MSDNPTFRYVTPDVLDELRKIKAQPCESIQTPIPSWNNLCGEEGGHEGIAKTWTVVLGGMPGSRKTYLALNMAAHAIRRGRTVGAINFEMSFAGYITRYLAILAGVSDDSIGWGHDFDNDSWEDAKQALQDAPGDLITNHTTVFTIEHIKEAYRRFEERGVDMVVVDYVQLVDVTQVDGAASTAKVVSSTLRECSHKHNVATVAVSQINRQGMNPDDTPRTHHLYGGMYWQSNANQIIMLDHSYEVNEGDRTRTHLIVDKNRHGQDFVKIPVVWKHESMTVEEAAPQEKQYEDMLNPEYFDTAEDEIDDIFGDEEGDEVPF